MKVLLALLCILFLVQVNAQTVTALSNKELKALLNKQFRLIVGENANGGFGNFAGIDLSESKRVAFSPAFVLDTGNILAFKIGAGYSDGISDLFKNSKINSNVSLDADYHFLPRVRHRPTGQWAFRDVHVMYLPAQFIEYRNKRAAASDSKRIDSIEIDCGAAYYAFVDSLHKELKKLHEQHVKDSTARDSIIKIGKWTDMTRTQQEMIEWHDCKEKKYQAEYSIVLRKIAENASRAHWDSVAMDAVQNKYSDANLPYENENITLRGARFGWVSIGAGVRRDDFKLFDPTAPYQSRVTDEDFTSFQARLKYSYFSWAKIPGPGARTLYASGGITYNYKSNYLDLSSSEITRSSNFGSDTTSPANQLDKIEKFNAYEGTYKAKIHEIVLNAELYRFFLSEKTFALHIYGDLRMTKGVSPRFGLGAGILFPFQDKEKEKSILNAELYWSFSDLFQTSKIYEEDKVGLRFSFPINFNPFKSE